MSKPDLSIIVISFNTKQITLDCLRSIFRETEATKVNFEVIVYENGSKDGSGEAVKELQKQHKNLVLVENAVNIGFGRGNNEAVKSARGEYILLLNSDIIVLDRAIEKLFAFYIENSEKMQFLGGKLFNKDVTPQPSAAPFYTLPVVFLALFMRGDYWGATRNSPSKTTETGWVSGACILVKKHYYEALKGFDERIFMYMEEVDLLYRAKKHGYQTWFYPGARFIHLGSASSSSSVKRTAPILQVYKGLMYFYDKHYGSGAVFLLKLMLKLKAVIGIVIGRIFKNNYLTSTYEEAYKLVTLDRR